MSNKIYGYTMSAINVESDHASRPNLTNGYITINFIKEISSAGLVVFDDVIRFNIYSVAACYAKINNLKQILFSLADTYLEDKQLYSEGFYTTKEFDKQFKLLERDIKKGLYL